MDILYKRNLENALAIRSLDLSIGSSLDDLYDTRLASYTHFTSGSDIVRIEVEFSAPLLIDSIGVGGHSFGDGSTISVNGGPAEPLSIKTALVRLSVPEENSLFEIEIYDPTLTPGEPRYIGRLELGERYKTPDISPSVKIDAISSSDAVFSSSRQVYGYRRSPFSRLSVQLPVVEPAEGKALIEFFKYVDIFVPFFISTKDDCLEIADNYTVLSDSNLLAFQLTEGLFYTSSLVLSEVF